MAVRAVATGFHLFVVHLRGEKQYCVFLNVSFTVSCRGLGDAYYLCVSCIVPVHGILLVLFVAGAVVDYMPHYRCASLRVNTRVLRHKAKVPLQLRSETLHHASQSCTGGQSLGFICHVGVTENRVRVCQLGPDSSGTV
jgi:hypothetical protein